MLLKEPLCLLVAPPDEPPLPLVGAGISAASLTGEPAALPVGESPEPSWLRGRDHRSFLDDVDDSKAPETACEAAEEELEVVALAKRKMWTVSDTEETQRRVEVGLKDML